MELLDYEKKHLEELRDYLSECTVLLKKDGSFPLKEACEVALYGSGARNTIKGGTGSGEVNSRFFVNVEDGLKECGFTVTTKHWLDVYDEIYKSSKKDFLKEVKREARKNHKSSLFAGMGLIMPEPNYVLPLDGSGDVAIYVVGRISGEGMDRKNIKGDILLSDTEVKDILLLNNQYEKFVLVINAGGVVDLTPVKDVKNILVLSQLGVETGSALGRILLGDSPSGKLATTWASYDKYSNVGDFGDNDDTHYKEGVYVGYRYFDSSDVEPLFPFGYGLTYTEFEHEVKDVEVNNTKVEVEVEVKNVGEYASKEVIQAYLSMPHTKLDHPYQDLVAFNKTKLLKEGEKEVMRLSFDLKDFASYSENEEKYFLEKGNYVLRVGNSSKDTKAICNIYVNEEIDVRRVKNILAKPGFEDYKKEAKEEFNNELSTYSIEASVDTEIVVYDSKVEVDEFIKSLEDEELMRICMGNFNEKGGLTSFIGNAGSTIAGTAGETTKMLKEMGQPGLILADGPAGIRIARDYVKDEKGVYSLAGMLPESMMEGMSPLLKGLLKITAKKPKKGEEVLHQYCTAIPIGTAIAQSFNEEFAKVCGDIVGSEMEHFGIHLWLAPALNIHRDIRCGRNFEYFSEDPLISGKMASAITKGVQSHKGCGTTIKHFVANNQETNRTGSNSIMSERVFREIYLRGFEICIKESQPHALMTSYNLLNGEHTNERKDLCEDVLRSEIGFKGIIMTDWEINHGEMFGKLKYPGVYADKVAASGNDLFMPGSKNDFEDLKKGFEKGTVTREDLERNASRIYRMCLKLNDTDKE